MDQDGGVDDLTDEGSFLESAAAMCREHPRTARIQVYAGPVEDFHSMVNGLIAAGAHNIGGRYFQVRPPLSAQQISALRRLAGLDPLIEVTVDPRDADVWHAAPTAVDPPRGFVPYAWWRWQHDGANPDDQPLS